LSTEPTSPQRLAVIFLTLNEAFHLGDAIDNIADIADEIFVLDSLSNDETVSIALEKGATVVQRPFTNFGDQWNFSLDHLPTDCEWTLKMDPDERLSDELKDQMRVAMADPKSATGFEFPRRLWFMGKPLHFHQDVVRLWKTGHCQFSDVLVNEHPIVDGEVHRLPGLMEHFDSRDLHHWIDKQNFYTSLEAISRYQSQELSAKPNLFGSALERRMFFKKYFAMLPFGYFLLFLYNYIIGGAWKAGKTGFRWARMRCEVHRLIDYKYHEMVATGRIPDTQQFKNKNRVYDQRIADTPLQKSLVSLLNFEAPEKATQVK
jgi:glycosyltransferase involved in cell wall biosynthesis